VLEVDLVAGSPLARHERGVEGGRRGLESLAPVELWTGSDPTAYTVRGAVSAMALFYTFNWSIAFWASSINGWPWATVSIPAFTKEETAILRDLVQKLIDGGSIRSSSLNSA